MTTNPILEELYAARAELLARYGNDLGAYLRDAAERTRKSGHPIAQIQQRSILCTRVSKPGDFAAERHLSPPCDR